MSANDLKVAVIGAGMAGRAHAYGFHLLASGLQTSGIRPSLSCVADPDDAAATALVREFGFERKSPTWQEVAAADDIDAVSVAVRNEDHHDVVRALLEAGKHVLCEKPLTTTVEDAEDLVRTARSAGVVAAVGFVNRFAPAVAAIRETVTRGRLGSPRIYRGRYWSDYAHDDRVPFTWRYGIAAGGGAVVDLGSHAIDMARFIFGDIVEVSGARLETFVHEREVAASAGRGHAIVEGTGERRAVENEDAAVVTVRFENGAIGDFSFTRVASGFRNALGFTAMLSRGAAGFDFERCAEFDLYVGGEGGLGGFRRVVVGPDHPNFGLHLPMPARGVGYGLADCFAFQARAFMEAIAARPSQSLATFEDGLAAVRICQAVQRSARSDGASVSVAVS